MNIKNVFLLKSNPEEEGLSATKENSDVVVELESGEKYIASFYTYESINEIRKYNIESGENLNGRFFWSKHMLITDSCELENIREIIEYLVNEGDFKYVFGSLTTNSIG